MSQRYFIIASPGQMEGPFDIVTIVKKIRNGSITAQTLVSLGETDMPKPLLEWKELEVFLREEEEEQQVKVEVKVNTAVKASFFARFGSGWNFLKLNQLSTLFSGFFVVLVLVLCGVVKLFVTPAFQALMFFCVFVLVQYLFVSYLYSVLRMVRGQAVDISFLRERAAPHRMELMITGVMMSLFLIIGFLMIATGEKTVTWVGLGLVTLPGFMFLALNIFAPLLILDRGMEYSEAMKLSRRTVRQHGLDTLGVIYALLIVNFIAGLFLMLPMIITLPVTLGAICELYDEFFE